MQNSKCTCFSCLCCGNRDSEIISEGILFGMGNPLLDITAVVDDEFLAKYKLQPDNAILLDGDGDKKGLVKIFYDLVDNYQVHYVAGGATQNTLRVAQWVFQKPNRTSYIGSVGNDLFCARLEELAVADGVNVVYQKWDDHRTGTCAALITGNNRSLCAHLAGSKYLTKEFLAQHFSLIKKAKFYYIEGYFLVSAPELMRVVAKHAESKNKIFTMNLSASYIPRKYTVQLLAMLPYTEILFGNKTEATAFARVQNFETEDIVEIGQRIVVQLCKSAHRPRIVVITQGGDPVIVLCNTVRGTEVKTFPVKAIPPEKIVDTNGAGDAFVGGFLAQYIMGKSIDECVKCGMWVSAEIIQQTGCTIPKGKVYTSES